MDFCYYQKYFSPDSIGRYDMAPLYSDPEIFMELLEDLIKPFTLASYEKIIALDATGFILGVCLVGDFVSGRKDSEGKLCED